MRRQNLIVITTGILLAAIFFRPSLIDWERVLEPKPVLVAGAEGAANCYTQLKLRKDSTFFMRISCFGIEHTKGAYFFRNDTFFLSSATLAKGNSFYGFGTIVTPDSNDHRTRFVYMEPGNPEPVILSITDISL